MCQSHVIVFALAIETRGEAIEINAPCDEDGKGESHRRVRRAQALQPVHQPRARLRRGGPEAARRSGQSSTARAGDRLSTIVRALLNGLKVLSRAALFRSPGYVAGLRRKRFRSARRRRANFDVRPIVEAGRT